MTEKYSQQTRDPRHKRVHSNSGTPQHEITRYIIFLSLTLRSPHRICDVFWRYSGDASVGDKVDPVMEEFIFRKLGDGFRVLLQSRAINKKDHKIGQSGTYCVQNVASALNDADGDILTA